MSAKNPLEHPDEYFGPSGIECIQVVEHMSFNIGNAVKLLWRCGKKGDHGNAVDDLRKAGWYIAREIERLAYIHEAEKRTENFFTSSYQP